MITKGRRDLSWVVLWLGSLLPILLIQGCRSTELNIKVWEHRDFEQTEYDSADRFFPEKDDPELAYPKLEGVKDDSTFGIVFSGGGTRSASATLGQMRALKEIGWLKKAHYISAVSGGSWASLPYIYLPGRYDDETYLGSHTPPAALTEAELNSSPKNSLTDNISSSILITRVIAGGITGKADETYSYTLGRIFLAPYGLADRDRFFTAHEGAFNVIRKHHGELFDRDDFYIIEKSDRPYPIIGGTILKAHPFYLPKRDPYDVFPLEMTPLYTGSPSAFEYYDYKTPDRYKGKNRIGGGYIESYGYDSKAPEEIKTDGRTRVEIKRRFFKFTLSDVIGTSGSAPQRVLTGPLKTALTVLAAAGLGTTFAVSGLSAGARIGTAAVSTVFGIFGLNIFGFPEFQHWPVDTENPDLVDEMEYAHGDGGNIDNIGIMPLLSRKVKNILVFVNTNVPFKTGANEQVSSDEMYIDLINYFRPSKNYPHNQVFREAELVPLYKSFERKKLAGKPLIHCQEYEVKRNARFGVLPYKPNICWVYLDRTESWIEIMEKNDRLGPCEREFDVVSCKELLLNMKGRFKRFPHYNTFFQSYHNLNVVKLHETQVNMLANLTAWTVLQGRGQINEQFDFR